MLSVFVYLGTSLFCLHFWRILLLNVELFVKMFFFFSFNNLNVTYLLLLMFCVFKHQLLIILLFLCTWWVCFSGCFQDFIFVFSFQWLDCDVSICDSLCIRIFGVSWIYVFFIKLGSFQTLFSNIFLPLYSFSGNPSTSMLVCFSLAYESLRHFIFLHSCVCLCFWTK